MVPESGFFLRRKPQRVVTTRNLHATTNRSLCGNRVGGQSVGGWRTAGKEREKERKEEEEGELKKNEEKKIEQHRERDRRRNRRVRRVRVRLYRFSSSFSWPSRCVTVSSPWWGETDVRKLTVAQPDWKPVINCSVNTQLCVSLRHARKSALRLAASFGPSPLPLWFHARTPGFSSPREGKRRREKRSLKLRNYVGHGCDPLVLVIFIEPLRQKVSDFVDQNQ